MTEFTKCLEILYKRQATPRMTTGNADLDSLLGGGVEPGQFYLFYGDKKSGVDQLIHQVIVNSLLPTEKFGFNGKSVYANCGNYRQERTMLDTSLLCFLVKAVKLDPAKALDDIYTICSFSEEQEEQVFLEIQNLLQRDPEIKLVAFHNIAKLFTTNTKTPLKNRGERIMRLQKIVFRVWQVCAENNLAFVASCRPAQSNNQRVPEPEGGKYLAHKATVIVYFKKRRRDLISAYLIKHPNRAPKKISLESKMGGENLGRITPPFRTLFQEEMNNLKRTYREALMDAGRRDAFDSLVKTWSSEQGAMSYARVPTALDVMLLTGVIDNRKLVEDSLDQLGVMSSKLEKIESILERRVE